MVAIRILGGIGGAIKAHRISTRHSDKCRANSRIYSVVEAQVDRAVHRAEEN